MNAENEMPGEVRIKDCSCKRQPNDHRSLLEREFQRQRLIGSYREPHVLFVAIVKIGPTKW